MSKQEYREVHGERLWLKLNAHIKKNILMKVIVH